MTGSSIITPSAWLAGTPPVRWREICLFIATLLGIPFEQLVLSVVVKSTVHHAEFNLSEEEQAQFVGKAVQESGVADVTNFLRNVLEARKYLRWQRITGNSC